MRNFEPNILKKFLKSRKFYTLKYKTFKNPYTLKYKTFNKKKMSGFSHNMLAITNILELREKKLFTSLKWNHVKKNINFWSFSSK